MSIAMMTLAWKSGYQSGRKMVLLALCDNANDQGECYPSIAMIAGKCSMSERSVFNHISELEKDGSIHRENRSGRSTIYHIDPCKFCTPANSAPLQPLHTTPANSAPPPLQRLHPTPATVAPITINEPSIEPKKKNARALSTFVLPDWINEKHWDAWHSCDKRKKASDEQKQLAVEKLATWRLAGIDYASALENAAVAGWQGLFKPDDKTLRPNGFTPVNTHKYAAAARTIFSNDADDLRTFDA